MDMLDGQVARHGRMITKFGALYDSVLDRYSELIMFFGICYFLISHDYLLSSFFSFIALIGSMMVSYTRSRAEGLGIECGVGFMQRPERVGFIGLSATICGLVSLYTEGNVTLHIDAFPFPPFETISIFTIPVIVVAIMANFTAIQRLLHCRKELEKLNQ